MKFKVGDRVILDNLNRPNARPNTVPELNEQVGKIFTIRDGYTCAAGGYYTLKGSGWYYREDWLRPAGPALESILTKKELKLLKELNNEV